LNFKFTLISAGSRWDKVITFQEISHRFSVFDFSPPNGWNVVSLKWQSANLGLKISPGFKGSYYGWRIKTNWNPKPSLGTHFGMLRGYNWDIHNTTKARKWLMFGGWPKASCKIECFGRPKIGCELIQQYAILHVPKQSQKVLFS